MTIVASDEAFNEIQVIALSLGDTALRKSRAAAVVEEFLADMAASPHSSPEHIERQKRFLSALLSKAWKQTGQTVDEASVFLAALEHLDPEELERGPG